MSVRLRTARVCAGFKSASAAIEHFQWKSSTYRAHENGQNNYDVNDAAVYARAFNVSASWLLLGNGKGPSTQIPEIFSKTKIHNQSAHKHDCVESIYACAVLLRDDKKNLLLLSKIKECADAQIKKQN